MLIYQDSTIIRQQLLLFLFRHLNDSNLHFPYFSVLLEWTVMFYDHIHVSTCIYDDKVKFTFIRNYLKLFSQIQWRVIKSDYVVMSK